MSTNLESYKVFIAIAETGSFSLAAKKLHITQPAVSQTISNLEDQLDILLFKRSGKGAELTSEGKMLYSHVFNALHLIQNGEKKLDQIKNLQAGRIHIGSSDNFTKHFLMHYIKDFHASHKDVKIQVTNRTSLQLIRLLETGVIDFAVVNLPVKNTNLKIIPCKKLQDIFVAGSEFKYLKDQLVPLQHIAKLPLVMLEKQANSRIYVENFFSNDGLKLTPEIELGAYDLLFDFAKIGLGLACVIKEFSKKQLQDGELFELKLEKPIPPREMGICYLKDIEPSYATKKFIEFIVQ